MQPIESLLDQKIRRWSFHQIVTLDILAISRASNSQNKYERLLGRRGKMLHDLFVALALVLVIEGLLYAAFPNQMRSLVSEWPSLQIRHSGRQVYLQPRSVAFIWIIKEFFKFIQP